MVKELPIIINPDPILRNLSAEIPLSEINQKEFQEFLADMEKTMKAKDGAGLAAPQVGKNIRVVVIQEGDRTYFMINPQITKKSWARITEEEGCLSVLNEKGEIIYAPIERHKKVSCSYYDEKGEKRKISAEKMFARAIQHEIDHLDGILFIDHLKEKGKGIKK
jgi:peptide deformylase